MDAAFDDAPSERALVDATHRQSLGDGDPLSVWHAAEVALGMLDSRYLPKREAVADIAEKLTAWKVDDES